jgi:hypothetical protein
MFYLSYGITFYVGSGSKSGSGTGTGTGFAKAKSCDSCGYASGSTTLALKKVF